MVRMATLLPSVRVFKPRVVVAAWLRVWVPLVATVELEVVPVLVSPVLLVVWGASRPGRRVATAVASVAVAAVEMCSKAGVHPALQVAAAAQPAAVAKRAAMVPVGKSA